MIGTGQVTYTGRSSKEGTHFAGEMTGATVDSGLSCTWVFRGLGLGVVITEPVETFFLGVEAGFLTAGDFLAAFVGVLGVTLLVDGKNFGFTGVGVRGRRLDGKGFGLDDAIKSSEESRSIDSSSTATSDSELENAVTSNSEPEDTPLALPAVTRKPPTPFFPLNGTSPSGDPVFSTLVFKDLESCEDGPAL